VRQKLFRPLAGDALTGRGYRLEGAIGVSPIFPIVRKISHRALILFHLSALATIDDEKRNHYALDENYGDQASYVPPVSFPS
jgi:hypothetical protein